MGLYKVVTFPYISSYALETNDINEAKNYIEDKYRQTNDIERRKWFRTDDGYVFSKPELDGSIILNKKYEWGIKCQEKTNDRFDEIFNHPNTEKNKKEDEKKKYYVSFEIISTQLAIGYTATENITTFDKNDLKHFLIEYYKKEDLIEVIVQLLADKGKLDKIK